jgi:hypothetical protein
MFQEKYGAGDGAGGDAKAMLRQRLKNLDALLAGAVVDWACCAAAAVLVHYTLLACAL